MASGESPARDPFAALGDPNRRAIVELLAEASRSVNEIAGELPISRPAVSRHLKLLKDAGLVVAVAEGTRRLYRLDDAGAAMMARYMEDIWGEAVARFRIVVENTRPSD
ncbi:MAG: ArsR/SmtB family transcription factor [Acidimicrobiia bacterium]